MQIGFVNSSKHWVSRQVQLPLRLFSLVLIFRLDHWRLCNRLQHSHVCGDYLANAQRNRTSAKEKVLPLEQPSRLQQIVPPPVPASAAATFEVHEAFPVEPQQPSIIKTAVESDATASQVVAKRAESKRDIATLLGSKSSLREAILIREILGPPRGLQALDLL